MVWVLGEDGEWDRNFFWLSLKKNLFAADEFYLNPILQEQGMDKGLCPREALNAFVSNSCIALSKWE